MKEEDFKQRLSEVAEWRLQDFSDVPNPDTYRYSKIREEKRLAREQIELDDDEEVEQDLNLTTQERRLAIELVKIKVQACVCEDCGKICENGCQKQAKVHYGNGKPHWRKRCLTCGMYHNPFTGKYDLKQGLVSATWVNWLRDGRRLRLPKNLKKE